MNTIINYLYTTSETFSHEKHKPMHIKSFGFTTEYFYKIQNDGNSLKILLYLRFD